MLHMGDRCHYGVRVNTIAENIKDIKDIKDMYVSGAPRVCHLSLVRSLLLPLLPLPLPLPPFFF